MNKLNRYRFMLIGLAFLGLGFVTACGDNNKTPAGKDQKEPGKEEAPELSESEYSLQKIFDEAAKGKTANLALMKKMYDKLVTTPEQANTLAALNKDSNNFLCNMMSTEFKPITNAIVTDLLLKVSDAKVTVNEECKGAKHSIDLALATGRVGDEVTDAQQIVYLLATKGGSEAIAKADDGRKLDLLFTAVNEQGSQDELVTVLKDVPLDRSKDWLAANQDNKVKDALKISAVVTLAAIVDAAKDAATRPILPERVEAVKLFYKTLVEGDATGVKGYDLARLAPTGGAADRFLHFVLQVPADDEVLAIVEDLFAQESAKAVAAGGIGPDAVLALINEPGAGTLPLNHALAALADPASVAGNKMVKLLVEKDVAGLTADVDPPAAIAKLLTAMRNESVSNTVAAFNAAFAEATLKNDAIAWASANLDEPIARQVGAPSLRTELLATYNLQMLVDEAAKGPAAANLGLVSFLYKLNVTTDALAQDLIALGSAGVVAGPGVDGALNYFGALAATAGMRDIFIDIFTRLEAAGVNVALAINQAGASGSPFLQMVDEARVPPAGEDANVRNRLIALMARKGNADTIQLANNQDKLNNLLNAVLEQDPTNLNDVVANVDLTTRRAELYAWFTAAALRPDADQVNRAAAAADSLVSYEKILEEVAKGPGLGGTDIPLLKDMFDIKVNRATVAADAALALVRQAAAGGVGDPAEDMFVNFLAQLPADADTRDMWRDLLRHLDNPAALDQINRTGASGSPIAVMLDAAEAALVMGDELKDTIALMVDKGGEDAVRAAANPVQLAKLLDIVLEKNNAILEPTVAHLLPIRNADLLAWYKTKYADAVYGARIAVLAAPLVDNDMIVAEAARGAGANLGWLKFMFDAKVTRALDPGAAARDLVAVVPAGLGPERFVSYLALLPVDATTAQIWETLLTSLAADAPAQINLAAPGFDSPIQKMLDAAVAAAALGPVSDELQDTIALMGQYGNAATVRVANDAPKLDQLLGAVLAKKPAFLDTAIARINRVAREVEFRVWFKNNFDSPLMTLEAKRAGITEKMIVDEAAALAGLLPAAIDAAWLKKMFDAKVTGALDPVAAAQALVGVTLGGADQHFVNYLAQLPVDATTKPIWDVLFAQLDGIPDAVKDEINRGGANSPIARLLPTVRPADDPAMLAALIAVMAEKGEEAAVRAATSSNRLTKLLNAVLGQGGDIGAAIGHVNKADADSLRRLRTWLLTNHTGAVTPAMVAGVFRAPDVLTEAAKGPAGAPPTDVTFLKFMYQAMVTGADPVVDLATVQALADERHNVVDTLANLLTVLPTGEEVHFILNDMFAKLTASADPLDPGRLMAQVNTVGTTGAPFATLVGRAADSHSPQVIALMARVAATDPLIVAAVADADLDKLYGAVRLHGDKALLQAMFTQTENILAKNIALLRWVEGRRVAGVLAAADMAINGGTVMDAFTDSVRVDARLDHAAISDLLDAILLDPARADVPLLRLAHLAFVRNLATVAALAGHGAAPQFSSRLANLKADGNTQAIWFNQLTRLGAGAGAELNKGDLSVPPKTVMNLLLGDRTALVDVQDRHDEIVLKMVQSDDGTALAAVVGADEVKAVLDILLVVGNLAEMTKAFRHIGGAVGTAGHDAMIKFAMENRTNKLGGPDDNAVLEAMRAAGRVDEALLMAEVTGVTNWKKVLFYVQVLAHDQASAEVVALYNVAGTLLHNLIVAKAQTAESVKALKHYLSFLPLGNGTPTSWDRISDNDAGAGQRADEILRDVAHDGGQADVVGADDNAEALRIFLEADGVTATANPPVADPIEDQGPI